MSIGRKRNEHIRSDPKYEALLSEYASRRKANQNEPRYTKVIVVSPSKRMKPESAWKKWIRAHAGLSGVGVGSACIKIRQELGRPGMVQQCNIMRE